MTHLLRVPSPLCVGLLLLACSPTAPDADAGRDAPALDSGSSEDGGGGGSDGGIDPCAAGACGPCDDGLSIDDGSAANAARAIGACSGIVAAAWTLPDGSAPTSPGPFDLGHGLLDGFGTAVSPREGGRLLALSSGAARDPADPGYTASLDKGYGHAAPAGFPFEAPACPGTIAGGARDGVALTLTLDVPAGANGLRVLLKHHTGEWPSYLCSTSNDVSAVLVSPPPPGAHASGDVALDADGNPLSVNSSLIDVCTCVSGPPCDVGGRSFACAAGAGELAGTGFDPESAAATEWLELRIPAAAGARIEVRLAVWDSGDGVIDATTLYDGFRWITDAPAQPELRVAP